MGPKRATDTGLPLTNKLPRIEQNIAASPLTPLTPQPGPGSDFSSSVKRKLASSSRTGQACDRCKVRKIRCDGRPEGCSPCAQNHTPCQTTDRITGRPTRRGQAQAMEAEISFLRNQVAELQAQVKELGAEPVATAAYPAPSWPSSQLGHEESGWTEASQQPSRSPSLSGHVPAGGVENTEYRALPQFKPGSIGDNYLGVSSEDPSLSHIKGTTLSVFGAEIDITDFVLNEAEYDKSVMSYDHFLKVIFSEDTQVEPVPFPEYKKLHEYSNWYFRSLNPYTMLMDKPTFMDLVFRIGNEANFSPSPAETISVHMMLATIKYQISTRNGEASMMSEAHKHYRYSLSLFKHCMHGHRWQDVQALAMICQHMRNFPKPGAAWIMVSTTFLLAVELGLHRSTKAWADSGKMDRLEVEMRKRIFWALHGLATNLCGKLGRPMPINVDDIDVEFPEPANDCLPGEDNGLSSFRQCSFQVGIQTAKYTVWSSTLFRTVYAVRQSPRGYENAVKHLEAGIRRWRMECPPELADPQRALQEDYIFALYLEFWEQEFQLLLHHPAVCRSTDPEFVSSNLDKCLAASEKMLHNCNQLRKFRSLDIPWINTVVYVAAIFTTLFIYNQRKDQMTLESMNKLNSDMIEWIDVMGDCGQLLGTGERLKNAVEKIVHHSLKGINDSVAKRTATESLARVALQAPQAMASRGAYQDSNLYEPYDGANSTSTGPPPANSGSSYAGAPPATSFPYNNGSSMSGAPNQQARNTLDQRTYGANEEADMTPSHAAALAAAAAAAAAAAPSSSSSSGAPGQGQSVSYAYSNPQPATDGFTPHYNGVAPMDWHQWSRNNVQQVGPPGEYLNSASMLLSLGGREGSSHSGQGEVTPGAHGPGLSNVQWPTILFSGHGS